MRTIFRLSSIYLLTLTTLSIAPVVHANYAEFFGSSPENAAIGNQANSDSSNPANNYYVPAITAFNRNINFSIFASNFTMDVPKINNIVTKNSTNSTTLETGDANTKYGDQNFAGFNVSLPILDAGTIALTAISPIGDFIQTNSGDPRLPEYVLYRSRMDRTTVFLNYAHAINSDWAFSVGTHIGYQVGGHTNNQISLNGTSFGSSASGKSKASPSLGVILSVIKKWDEAQVYLTYQQQMKSNMQIEAFGEINDPIATLVNVRVDSMLYYDPHIFRLGGSYEFSQVELATSLEYQIWEDYRAPTFRIVDLGGAMLPSNNYEVLKIRNILVPKIGLVGHLTDNWDLMIGSSYRMSPLDSNFSGNGNSIDTDALIYTTGVQYSFKLWEKTFSVGASLQYYDLEERKVVKSSRQENGEAGQKIGAPGYEIGGEIITSTLAFKVNF